jgi:acetoin utilization deacetylase AcuC-like enzyme
LRRIAILDFDVHHGNGTEDIFRRDERVLLCSSYQHPYYPYSEVQNVPGHIIHAPLPGGSGGSAFRDAITAAWLPALAGFKPEMIFVSAGFDAHVEDEMSGIALTEADYRWITDLIMEQADATANGRIVSTLEGGYALSALGRSVEAHLRSLMKL